MLAKLKKIGLALLAAFATYIVISLIIMNSKDSFSWAFFSSLFTDTVKTEQQNIETKGNNARAYYSNIQDPNTGKWYRCRDMFASKGGGSTCWETKKPKDK